MRDVRLGLGRLKGQAGQVLACGRNIGVADIMELETDEGVRSILAFAFELRDRNIGLAEMASGGLQRRLLLLVQARRGTGVLQTCIGELLSFAEQRIELLQCGVESDLELFAHLAFEGMAPFIDQNPPWLAS